MGSTEQCRKQNQGLVKTPMFRKPLNLQLRYLTCRGIWESGYSVDLNKDNIPDYLGSPCNDKAPWLRIIGGLGIRIRVE